MRPSLLGLALVWLLAVAPIASARIAPEFFRAVVRAHLHEIQACYAEGLARRPALAGRVVLRWTIAESGEVIDAGVQSSELGDPLVELCMVARVRGWTFPANGRGTIRVSYPFELRPFEHRPSD